MTGSWLLNVTLTAPPPGVTVLSYKTLMTFTADGDVLETSWATRNQQYWKWTWRMGKDR